VVATEKLLDIARRFQKPIYFCHITTKEEMAMFTTAREKGIPFFTEVTPHHLFLTVDDADDQGNFAKINPPIRDASAREALQKALKTGLIDTIASDHAPHTREEKERPYAEAPSGMPGVETMLPLLLDFCHKGKMSLSQLVRCMAKRPAEIFGIRNRGSLEEGYYADITIVDQDLTRMVKDSTIYTKCKWSSFFNCRLTGWPVITIVNGVVAFDRGRFPNKPMGKEVF
jgi:dihydroorotase